MQNGSIFNPVGYDILNPEIGSYVAERPNTAFSRISKADFFYEKGSIRDYLVLNSIGNCDTKQATYWKR